MKKRLISTVLALCLCVSVIPNAHALQEDSLPQENLSVEESAAGPVLHDEVIPTYQEAYNAMIALKDDDRYKEGTTWTNYEPYSDSKGYYQWNGGPINGTNIVSAGCAAFAFILSDAAFGSLPARTSAYSFENVKVGDILRMNTDTHTVIVLEVSDAGVVIAEGNFSGKVHWGRAISKDVLARDVSTYITRYPEGYVPSDDPNANEVLVEGNLDGLNWKLTNAGTLTISGNGAIPDYSSASEQPWYSNASKIRKIVIEDGVTRIGSCAFWQTGVLSVELPDSVTAIGSSSFRESSLIAVNIPSSVNTIGDSAFRQCQNLASVTVSEGVEKIVQNAFRACTSLTSIDLPASIGEVGAGAFMECTNLTSATFASGGKQVKIGDNLFTRCYYLMSVILPKSIDCIGEGMFQNDSMLAGVEIPRGAASIGGSAFASSGVEVVIIPDSVGTIGIAAFSACPLSDIYFAGTEAQWKNVRKIGDTASAVSKVTIHYNYAYSSEHTHSWATEWSSSATHHWHDCTASDCTVAGDGQKDGYAAHVYDDDTDAVCNICDYIRTSPDPGTDPAPDHTHSWAEEWSSSATHHWHDCTASDCTVADDGQKDGYAAHVYDDDTDAVCNICDYIRTSPDPGTDPAPDHTHSWAAEWSSSATHHWHDCTASDCTVAGDGQKDSYAAHVYDDDADAACNICGFIRTVSSSGSSSSSSSSSNGSRPSSGSGSSSTSTTVTTKNPDGSTTTKTKDKTTGTITETTKNTDGSQTVVETRKDGTAAAVTTSSSGQTTAEVTLPAAAVSEGRRTGKTIILPINEVRATRNTADAPAVTVKTGSKEPVKVEIPTENVTPGTVAVMVNTDGSEAVVKTTVPTESGVVVSLPDGATVKIVDNSRSFTDVSTAYWARDAINFASARELFSGTTPATFAPEAPMTRAMLMTVLARYDGEDTSGGAVWYEKGMEWAVANAISDGSNPNDNISREQLVSMLWRYSGSPTANSTLSAFTDAGEISGYAQQAMRWAVEKGIISGYGNGQLNPKGQATRAEVALMIMRYSSTAYLIVNSVHKDERINLFQ